MKIAQTLNLALVVGVGVPALTKSMSFTNCTYRFLTILVKLYFCLKYNFSKVVFLSEIFIRKSAYKNTTIYNFVLQIEDFFVAVSVCSFVHISMWLFSCTAHNTSQVGTIVPWEIEGTFGVCTSGLNWYYVLHM